MLRNESSSAGEEDRAGSITKPLVPTRTLQVMKNQKNAHHQTNGREGSILRTQAKTTKNG